MTRSRSVRWNDVFRAQSSWQGSNLRQRAYKAHALATELQEVKQMNRCMPSGIIALSFVGIGKD
jgi:hypothetical protein